MLGTSFDQDGSKSKVVTHQVAGIIWYLSHTMPRLSSPSAPLTMLRITDRPIYAYRDACRNALECPKPFAETSLRRSIVVTHSVPSSLFLPRSETPLWIRLSLCLYLCSCSGIHSAWPPASMLPHACAVPVPAQTRPFLRHR